MKIRTALVTALAAIAVGTGIGALANVSAVQHVYTSAVPFGHHTSNSHLIAQANDALVGYPQNAEPSGVCMLMYPASWQAVTGDCVAAWTANSAGVAQCWAVWGPDNLPGYHGQSGVVARELDTKFCLAYVVKGDTGDMPPGDVTWYGDTSTVNTGFTVSPGACGLQMTDQGGDIGPFCGTDGSESAYAPSTLNDAPVTHAKATATSGRHTAAYWTRYAKAHDGNPADKKLTVWAYSVGAECGSITGHRDHLLCRAWVWADVHSGHLYTYHQWLAFNDRPLVKVGNTHKHEPFGWWSV
jgi:hypothetical protein